MPAKDVLKIENMEQRQAALSVIPLSKMLKQMNAKLISVDTVRKGNIIELYKIEGDKLGVDEQVKILHYFCPSTGREYFDFVPENIETAIKGMCWKFGFKNIKDYKENMVIET